MLQGFRMNLNAILKKGFKEKKNSIVEFPVKIANSSFEGKNLICHHCYIHSCEIGFGTYIGEYSNLKNATIGKYCSIGREVYVLCGQHPISGFVSTHPAFYTKRKGFMYVDKMKFEEYRHVPGTHKAIIVGNDVWIGDHVKIMEGVRIGDGAVIASGAIITKDVPPYAVVGGIPAKIIKYRFEEGEREFLLKMEWWNKGEEWIRNYSECFEDIKEFMKILSRSKY